VQLKYIATWHFWPNVLRVAAVPDSPTYNPNLNPNPNPTNTILLTLTYLNVWPKISIYIAHYSLESVARMSRQLLAPAFVQEQPIQRRRGVSL